jgi:alpha-soluble NSF attachment protein
MQQLSHQVLFPLPELIICYLDAILSLEQAIGILTERGRFQSAAKHQEDIANIYESELIDLEQAMRAYDIAADWYAGESSTA